MRTFAPDFVDTTAESNKLHIKRFKTVTNYYKLSGKCKPESKPRIVDKNSERVVKNGATHEDKQMEVENKESERNLLCKSI